MFVCFFFFFKQKTAYEMRISDWSSDVCSSDLSDRPRVRFEPSLYLAEPPALFAIIRAAPKRCRELLLIGHNPGLEEFAQRLTGSAAGDALPRLTGKFPTAGPAELTFPVTTWAEITPESGFLASFVVPAQLGE